MALLRMVKLVLSFIASVIVASVLTSVFITQFNLAEVAGFGLQVSFSDRLTATAHDVIGLSQVGVIPPLPMVIASSNLVGFIVAALCHRFFRGVRIYWYMLAGFVSFPTALFIIAAELGGMMLAPARATFGMFVVALCSMTGGWLFARLSAKKLA